MFYHKTYSICVYVCLSYFTPVLFVCKCVTKSYIYTYRVSKSYINTHCVSTSYSYTHRVSKSYFYTHRISKSYIYTSLVLQSLIYTHIVLQSLIYTHIVLQSLIYTHIVLQSLIYTHTSCYKVLFIHPSYFKALFMWYLQVWVHIFPSYLCFLCENIHLLRTRQGWQYWLRCHGNSGSLKLSLLQRWLCVSCRNRWAETEHSSWCAALLICFKAMKKEDCKCGLVRHLFSMCTVIYLDTDV